MTCVVAVLRKFDDSIAIFLNTRVKTHHCAPIFRPHPETEFRNCSKLLRLQAAYRGCITLV